MKLLTNVKITNVVEDRVTRKCTIETNHPELPSFEATDMVHHGLVDMFFDDELAESYSILIDDGTPDITDGITPSGSEHEIKWREVFTLEEISA